MLSGGNDPVDGTVHVYEFVVWGKELGKAASSYDTKKKKTLIAPQLTEYAKVRRMDVTEISDFVYNARTLQRAYTEHKPVNTRLDKWL